MIKIASSSCHRLFPKGSLTNYVDQILPIIKHLPKAQIIGRRCFFPHPFICQRHFSDEKVENLKSKSTFIVSVLKLEFYMVLVFSISNFFTNKTSLANKWMSFSSNNSALSPIGICEEISLIKEKSA